MAIDQGETKCERLGHADQCIVDCSIAMWMEFAHHIADHPSVVLCWNSNTRFDVSPDGTVAADYHLVADRIGLVHLHDLTDQAYPWPELLRLLDADEYDGWCLAECAPASADPARVLAYFRSLFDAYRELGRRGVIQVPRS